MITKTDAFVMKSMRYRDTSKIVTFYSRQFGKIKGIAKGARDTKNKFGASLEPMTLSSLVLYKKEHRDLQLISQCDIVRPFKQIHSDMVRMEVALSVLELVNLVTHGEEENLPLFSLLTETFEGLEHAAQNHKNYLYAFMLRMASIFGFSATFQRCGECEKPIELSASSKSLMFDLGKGRLYCGNCSKNLERAMVPSNSLVRLSIQTAKILELLRTGELGNLPTIGYDRETGNKLDETLRLYIQHHFDGLRALRTKAVFQQINQ